MRPRDALEAMAGAVRKSVVLLFPDFVESGRFGSQPASGFWDRKLLLPRALRRARRDLGPFVVNLAPAALERPDHPAADFDAVYISCKADIEEWAGERGFRVEYPLGPPHLRNVKGVCEEALRRCNRSHRGRRDRRLAAATTRGRWRGRRPGDPGGLRGWDVGRVSGDAYGL